MKDFGNGVKQSLSRELAQKVVEHRDMFRNFFVNRYLEMLVNLYDYNIPSFDKARCELGLRQNYGIVFGKNRLGQDVILGYVPFDNTNSQQFFLYRRRYTGRDITYTLPNALLPENAKTKDFVEIWGNDNALTGDFVVILNKQVNLTSDYQIIQYYADELAEIEGSRFSLILQSKIMTIIAGEQDDTTLDQMITALYNGNPYVKVSKTFDVEDNIINIDNSSLSPNLQQLKSEYQNKLAELNAIFGINVLSVDKASGVTTSESNGNLSYVTGNANVWIESRQKALNLYNNRFGTDYKVTIDTDNGNSLNAKDGEGRPDYTKEGKLENGNNDNTI